MYRYSRVPTIRTTEPQWLPFRQSLRMDITLHPGEALFIPAGWFHFVHSTTADEHTHINVALSCMLTTLTEWTHCAHCVRYHEQSTDRCPTTTDRVSTLLPVETLSWNQINVDTLHTASRQRSPLYMTHGCAYLPKSIRRQPLADWIPDDPPPPVYTTESPDRVFRSNQPWSTRGSFHRELSSVPWNQLTNLTIPWYIMQHHVSLSTLGTHGFFPHLPWSDLPLFRAYLWINNGNVQSEMHYDMYDNLLISIQGRKRVLLFPVDQESCLFPLQPMPPCSRHPSLASPPPLPLLPLSENVESSIPETVESESD